MHCALIHIDSVGIILNKKLPEYRETQRTWPSGMYIHIIDPVGVVKCVLTMILSPGDVL